MKKQDLRTMGIAALAAEHKELKKEAMNLRFQQAMGQLENTAKRRLLRRRIARVLTQITQARGKNA